MEDETLKNVQDPSKEEKPQQELEKRIFHLKTLYDLSQEIGFLRGTQEITKNLLMMMIGNFGASCGFIFLFDTSRGKMDTCSQRGLPKETVDTICEKIALGDLTWLNKITQIETFDESISAQNDKREKLFDLFSSFGLRIWVPLSIDSNLRGGIGLGDKLSGDPYSSDDQELMVTMAHQGAVAVENAKLQQARIEALEQSKKELEKLSKAKSRALDHLSHELRTPLSVIQGNIRILKRKIQAQTSPLVRQEVFESLEKNLNRLSDIQQETDQIIRSYQALETRQQPVESDGSQPLSLERIDLYSFTNQILGDVRKQAIRREIQFHLEGDQSLDVLTDPRILEDILVGLLKNAIENTPDEGMIRVMLEQKKQWIQIKVMDFGIGITKENQRRLFDGLFHTLDTELYTSKKPYDFGAGGKGLDLLRARVYGQRFKFDISVGSQRCNCIPTDQDLCPGRISACPHCKKPEDCLSSGGSTFCISFPMRSSIELEQFEP
ncbi:MAG TPA: ATP-binding protein [Thermodesulfobacteriota bacterium]|nr:ATP-binding protein [Thermodesulfobacteriota bacterium]